MNDVTIWKIGTQKAIGVWILMVIMLALSQSTFAAMSDETLRLFFLAGADHAESAFNVGL